MPSGGAARAPPTHDQGLQSISSGEIAFQLLRDLEVGAPSATANGPAPAAPPPRGAAGAAAAASAASHPAARPLAPSAGAGAGGAGGGGFAPRMESLAEAASGDVTTGTGDDNCLTGTGDDLTCDEAGDDTTDQFDVAASPFCAAAAAPLRDGGDDAPAAGAAGMGARSGKGKPDAPGRGLNAACQPSVTSGPGGGGGAPPPGALAPAGRRRRRLVVMRRVMRDAYEYHGLNELGLFFTFAVLANFVLYFHWTDTTAAFKNTVQYSFRSYGNPDWQSQSLANVDTMLDGIEYMGGWAQFWIQRAMQVGERRVVVGAGKGGLVPAAAGRWGAEGRVPPYCARTRPATQPHLRAPTSNPPHPPKTGPRSARASPAPPCAWASTRTWCTRGC